MTRLTAVKVKNLKLPGRYGDGDGLYLNIAPGGSKSWIQRITVEGKRRDLGLGGYPGVSLAEARNLASDNRRAVREGRDLVPARKTNRSGRKAVPAPAPGIPTFREAAAVVHDLNGARWESAKTRNNWWQRAERYVFPAIGDMPIDRIGRTEALEILTPVWTAKPETARRIRLIVKTVMAWGLAYGHITVNPAGEVIDAALPSMPRVKEHFKSLPYPEAGAAIETVEDSTAFPATKLALKFLVLTAARSGEVRGATWDEIDFGNALWTIPAARMKGRREHRVPLSTGAMAVLREAEELPTGGSPYVFPNDLTPSKPLSENALSYMLRRVGVAAVVHGFRSSFRDWAAENTDASFAVMELALAHGVGSRVVQSYARSDLLERRRVLMQQWADYLQ
jgi:integrase